MMGGVMETRTEAMHAPVRLRERILSKQMIFPLGVATVAFYFVFRHLDVGAMVAIARRMHYGYYIAGFVIFYLSILLRGIRWRLLLINLGLRKSIPDATRVLFISWFAPGRRSRVWSPGRTDPSGPR